MRPMILAALAISALAGCATAQPPPRGPTQIRLVNEAPVEMTEIRASFGASEIQIARIAPGEASAYQEIAGTVGILYFEGNVGGERMVIQPHDFMGRRWPAGRYSVHLSFREGAAPGSQMRLQSRFARDP